jgi:NAD(P)-dependent dehydrogenase (short-subunit alcohol dehydrogenase family)
MNSRRRISQLPQQVDSLPRPSLHVNGLPTRTPIGPSPAPRLPLQKARSGGLVLPRPGETTGSRHEGAAGASIYVGAKHAVEGITKSVALEVAKSGIRVNAVAPGPTDTGMLTRFTGTAENKAVLAKQVPLGRLGLSEEVADGIVFIASGEARFITGHVLNVDGGHSAN